MKKLLKFGLIAGGAFIAYKMLAKPTGGLPVVTSNGLPLPGGVSPQVNPSAGIELPINAQHEADLRKYLEDGKKNGDQWTSGGTDFAIMYNRLWGKIKEKSGYYYWKMPYLEVRLDKNFKPFPPK